MDCPNCGYESAWCWMMTVFSREDPCIACGFKMDGAEFYNESSSEYVEVNE